MGKNTDLSGFAITEVLVASGLLAAIALGVTQMTQLSHKTQRHREENFNVKNQLDQISTILSDQNSCSKNLFKLTLGDDVPGLVQVKKDGSTQTYPELTPGNTIIGGGVVLKGYRISKFTVTAGKASGELEVVFERKGNNLRAEKIVKTIPFVANVDGANKIIDCTAAEGETAVMNEICQMIGATYNTSTLNCEIDPKKFQLLAVDNSQRTLQEELCKQEKWHILIFGGRSEFCDPPMSVSKCNWSGWYNFGTGHPQMNCQSGEIIDQAAWYKPDPPTPSPSKDCADMPISGDVVVVFNKKKSVKNEININASPGAVLQASVDIRCDTGFYICAEGTDSAQITFKDSPEVCYSSGLVGCDKKDNHATADAFNSCSFKPALGDKVHVDYPKRKCCPNE